MEAKTFKSKVEIFSARYIGFIISSGEAPSNIFLDELKGLQYKEIEENSTQGLLAHHIYFLGDDIKDLSNYPTNLPLYFISSNKTIRALTFSNMRVKTPGKYFEIVATTNNLLREMCKKQGHFIPQICEDFKRFFVVSWQHGLVVKEVDLFESEDKTKCRFELHNGNEISHVVVFNNRRLPEPNEEDLGDNEEEIIETAETYALRISGLKKGFDREEETHYQGRKVEMYDAILAAIAWKIKNDTELLNNQKTNIGKTIKERDIAMKCQSLMSGCLRKIMNWELPEIDEYWNEEHPEFGKLSYEAKYGSNGVRDYMKKLAEDTLEEVKIIREL